MLKNGIRRSIGMFAVLAGIGVLAGGCPNNNTADIPTDVVGSASAGQQKFSDTCSQCHSARSVATSSGRITSNMGMMSSRMSGIMLTDQDIADLRAYLATQ